LTATTIDEVISDDGRGSRLRWPEIRCLGPADEATLRRLLLALDPIARNERFIGAANDPSVSVDTEGARKSSRWVLGAFINGVLCGVVEIYCNEPDGDAEVAFVV
jgi:hypothetical protein